MIDYDEATAIRRSTRLVHDAGSMNFSVLNFMVYVLLIAMVVVAITSIF